MPMKSYHLISPKCLAVSTAFIYMREPDIGKFLAKAEALHDLFQSPYIL
jgi:hypothetical protein